MNAINAWHAHTGEGCGYKDCAGQRGAAGPFEEPKPAMVLDAGRVVVAVPPAFEAKIPELIARIEQLAVETDRFAKVVLNERTGTVVMGSDVKFSKVAIAHGSLTITVRESFEASQPNPLAAGDTAVIPESSVEVTEEKKKLNVVENGASLGDLVTALNALGVTPRDLIAILQAIKSAGALQAELEVI